MSDSELLSIVPAELSGDALLAKTLLALNNAHTQELSWLEPERLRHLVEQAFLARRIGSETLTPSYWHSIRMLDTTARISCGSAPAIRALSMWTGSWSHHRRAGAAARAGFIAICSNMQLKPDTSASSVKSTVALQTRYRMLSMRRWDSSRSARQASMMAAGRSGTCRTL